MERRGKSFWLRHERYRWLANGAGLLGAVLALLIVAIAATDDIVSHHEIGIGFIVSAVAMLAIGFVLPRYAVMSFWRTKLRSRLQA